MSAASPDAEQVFRAYYPTLFRFALSLVRNESDASDLAQQTCYLWASKGHQLQDPAKIKSWLMTTLHREFLGRRRHEKRFPHFDVASVEHELPGVDPASVAGLDAMTVMECLLQLDENHRVPLLLFYVEDMSYKEIGALLELPTGTVMSRLARGKDQLRRMLADQCTDGPDPLPPPSSHPAFEPALGERPTHE